MPVYQQARPDSGSRSQSTLNNFTNSSNVSISGRLEHFTWAWFTAVMSTGNLSVVLLNLPYRFRGLNEIGLAIYILDLVILILFVITMLYRFIRFPWTLKASMLHPTESLYVAAGLLSLATIVIGGREYGVKMGGFGDDRWFQDMLRGCFWGYAGASLAFTVAIHMTIWTTQTHTVDHMTPLWIMPIYPLLLVGPLAGAVAPLQSQSNAWNICLAGLALQGIGFMISVMIYSAYISRLMTAKLPIAAARPGMFVSVGPSAFTVITFVRLGNVMPHAFPRDLFQTPPLPTSPSSIQIPDTLSPVISLGFTLLSVFLWGLALWFFLVSVVGNLRLLVARKLHFSLGWWSFVFPNTAFILATLAVGGAVQMTALKILGQALTVFVVVLWILAFGGTIRGVGKRELLWPEVGEDRNEGGFRTRGRKVVIHQSHA